MPPFLPHRLLVSLQSPFQGRTLSKKSDVVFLEQGTKMKDIIPTLASFVVSLVKASTVPKDYDWSMGPMPNEYKYIEDYKWDKSEGANGVGEKGETTTQMQAKSMWGLWPHQPMNSLSQALRSNPALAQKIDAAFLPMKAEPALPPSTAASSDPGTPRHLEPYPDQEKLKRAKQTHSLSTTLKGVFP